MLCKLDRHCALRAASRAACTAGNNNAISMPMIAMTTSNSINVKPANGCLKRVHAMEGVLSEGLPDDLRPAASSGIITFHNKPRKPSVVSLRRVWKACIHGSLSLWERVRMSRL